jgi:hypothetical protein
MNSLQIAMTPEQADAFLVALMDPDYRARLEDPAQRKDALAEYHIDVSDEFSAEMVELPDPDVVQALREPEAELTLPTFWPFPSCCGLALALIVAVKARPPSPLS